MMNQIHKNKSTIFSSMRLNRIFLLVLFLFAVFVPSSYAISQGILEKLIEFNKTCLLLYNNS